MEARNRTLPDWMTRIRTRQIKLPRFQRHEAWTHQTVTGLLNTVLRGLPAGAVLVLEVGDEEPFVSRTMQGAPTHGEKVSEHLLDGQQRLTALWRALNNDYEWRSFFVQIADDEATNEKNFEAVSWGRWKKNNDGQKYPAWLNEPARLWEKGLIPVHLLRPDPQAETETRQWATQAAGTNMEVAFGIVEECYKLRQKFASFNIPFLSLPRTTSKETALNVFIQMNTSATPLSAYDIVVAQVEAGSEKSLHELTEELTAAAPSLWAYVNPADLMLSVGALMQDKPATQSSFLSKGFPDQLVADWPDIVSGITRAIDFLEQEKIYDEKRLPTDVVLAPLAALWAIAPKGLDAEGDARILLRKYLWRAFFTDRYERTSATRALVDYREIKAVLLHHADASVPILFQEALNPLASADSFLGAGWPVRRDRLPRALMALSLRFGGYDLADGSPAARANLTQREYHHLFPNALLKAAGISESLIFRALNCALITQQTNRNISAKPPKKYLAERIGDNSLGENELRQRLESYLIPYDALNTDVDAVSYEAFLTARAAKMHTVMLRLCEGQTV